MDVRVRVMRVVVAGAVVETVRAVKRGEREAGWERGERKLGDWGEVSVVVVGGGF